jgi:hypothetical protein
MTLAEFYRAELKKLKAFRHHCIEQYGRNPGEFPLELDTEPEWLDRYFDFLAANQEDIK